MTPQEILHLYGVDVTILPVGTIYYVATEANMWVRASGAPDAVPGDLFIETPCNYRSHIYAYKILSRCVGTEGPDKYIYIYHKIYAMGTMRDIVRGVINDWNSKGITGRMTFNFDYNKRTSIVVIVDCNKDGVVSSYKDVVRDINSATDLDYILNKFGNFTMVQNYKDETDHHSYYAYVGDGV